MCFVFECRRVVKQETRSQIFNKIISKPPDVIAITEFKVLGEGGRLIWSCYFGLGLGLVSSGLGLGLVNLVLVLRIWSCLHHCQTPRSPPRGSGSDVNKTKFLRPRPK